MFYMTNDHPGSIWRPVPARGWGGRLERKRLHRVKKKSSSPSFWPEKRHNDTRWPGKDTIKKTQLITPVTPSVIWKRHIDLAEPHHDDSKNTKWLTNTQKGDKNYLTMTALKTSWNSVKVLFWNRQKGLISETQIYCEKKHRQETKKSSKDNTGHQYQTHIYTIRGMDYFDFIYNSMNFYYADF